MGVLLGVAVAVGFRPHADALRWLGAIGVVALTAWALTWVAMAMGLSAKAPEGASSLPMPVILLPFLGSGFVPATSMSPGLRQFAEYQPFTPITETLRGLLLGTHIGTDWIQAVGWCVALTVAGYLGSRRLFDRRAEF
jgi:ABC-2 type transport system permease protein